MSHHYRSYPMILLAGLFLFILMLSLAGCVENMNSAGKPKESADTFTPETEFAVSDSWNFGQQNEKDTFDAPQDAGTPDPSSLGLNLKDPFNFDARDTATTGTGSDTQTSATHVTADASFNSGAGADSMSDFDNDGMIDDTDTASTDSEGSTSNESDSTSDVSLPIPATPTTAPVMMTYSAMEYGYAFNHPASWEKLQEEEGKIVFSVKKVVDEDTSKNADRATITVMYFNALQKDGAASTFEDWFSTFPVGSEKISVNGENLLLVDLDTDGPFGRDHYRTMDKSGVLKISLVFEPGYSVELETESAGWKNYLDASEKFRKEVFQQYLEMILSVKEDV